MTLRDTGSVPCRRWGRGVDRRWSPTTDAPAQLARRVRCTCGALDARHPERGPAVAHVVDLIRAVDRDARSRRRLDRACRPGEARRSPAGSGPRRSRRCGCRSPRCRSSRRSAGLAALAPTHGSPRSPSSPSGRSRRARVRPELVIDGASTSPGGAGRRVGARVDALAGARRRRCRRRASSPTSTRSSTRSSTSSPAGGSPTRRGARRLRCARAAPSTAPRRRRSAPSRPAPAASSTAPRTCRHSPICGGRSSTSATAPAACRSSPRSCASTSPTRRTTRGW